MTKILVVDDAAVDRRLVGGLLEVVPNVTIEYAENGVRALECIQAAAPELVVTDIHMPEMDGLELVTRIRDTYPHLPVILITGKGSEQTATEALARGAASYVPKSQLAEQLWNTVEQVLAVVRTGRSFERLASCFNEASFSLALENDGNLIDALVELVQKVFEVLDFADAADRLRIGVALEEALLNAAFHGNLELSTDWFEEARSEMLASERFPLTEDRRHQPPYANRRVHCNVTVSSDEARFVIRDEGPGFDTSMIAESQSSDALTRERGRGLVLIHTFMDAVSYNEAGNEVTLVKRRTKRNSAGDASTSADDLLEPDTAD